MKRKAASFSFASFPGKARELFPFIVGLLLMAAALYMAGKRVAAIETEIRRRGNPVEVVVASVPILAGEEFLPGNLAKKSVPASGTGKRNVPAGDFELLLGARAKSPIDPGEPVLWTDVEEPFEADALSRTVPKGKRALTVSVDTTASFSGMLQPGDRVDLLAKGSEGRTDTWIRNLAVIATDRNVTRVARTAEPSETGSVTLMVTPAEGVAITGASAGGRLFWFLRNPGDNNALPLARADGHPVGTPVEIWKGGHRVRQAPTGSGSLL